MLTKTVSVLKTHPNTPALRLSTDELFYKFEKVVGRTRNGVTGNHVTA